MNLDFISNNTGWVALLVVGGFIIWKYIIQPIQNEGQPIEDVETDQ